ncbi:MAG: primosomal protein DnaI [Candidatus Izemoplasmatales bacterium]|nr:primosomal protein DnaI [Candidatus Izemoplasmatales bacterium]MDD4068937.1 primosomal protein DnaI [Candidatus Izemoplasmatales bacterium]MDY0139315.1 primosomal protein DnaI [Candidatus Izemoplasmatales bacterium]
MKPIKDYINYPDQEIDYDSLVDGLMQDPVIAKFIIDNDLKHEDVIRSLNVFLTFRDEKNICSKCKGIDDCKLSTVGFTPNLEYNKKYIELTYTRCKYNRFNTAIDNIYAMYVPKKIFNASLDDYDLIGDTRKTINNYMLKFLKDYNKDNFVKGMYISGKYGTGKTYILAIMANELAKLGHKVYFAYYPDLARELKSSIGDGTLEEKITALKETEVLMLDDIGGEYFSEFIRDEVLGPILQHRLLDNKPTFFSSNLIYNDLAKSFRKNDNNLETISSFRIIERIKRMTVEFVLTEMPHIS